MDRHLKELLRSILEADPDAPLDDEGRVAAMYAMLGLHPGEHFPAIAEFANSIASEFKRSYVLYHLVRHVARQLEFDSAEQIARSIPLPYWRFSALSELAAELLKRDSEHAPMSSADGVYGKWADRLLMEIEQNLPSIPENDGDRATLLWSMGISMVKAGKLEWAESLASCREYCPENTDILLYSAKQRLARGQAYQAIQLARAVAELAVRGSGNLSNRTFDLNNVAELIFECGDRDEGRRHLEEAVRFGVASQDAHDIDGSKSLVAIAVSFAKYGFSDLAMDTALKITQPAHREDALKQIEQIRRV